MSECTTEDRRDPDPALDVWDPDWDSDWEPPHDWTATADDDHDADDGDDPGWTGEGEVFAAGFLHRDILAGQPHGAGFAAGGLLDQLEAGPALAAWASKVTSPARGGHADLGESELIGVLCAWRRLASWALAGQAAAIETLSRRRHAQARERADRHLSEHVGEEIAAALTLTSRAADGLYDDVLALARLRAVHARLAEGRIDWAKAVVFARELRDIPPAAAAGLAAKVLPLAPSMTTVQIRSRLRRLVLASDPDADRTRKADAAGDTEVVMWTETSGNAALAGRELPEADVLAVDRRLTALARWLSDRGVEGNLGQLRSAAFMTLLRGCPIQSLLPPGVPQTEGPGDPAGAGQPAVTGTVHLTMPLSALAGFSDCPGEVAAYGPVAADTCRDLAGLLSRGEGTRWSVSLVTPDGQAIATASAAAGHAAPAGPAAIRWAKDLAGQLQFPETGDCGHSRAEPRYHPSGRLRNLIIWRQPECSFPGCRHPAAGCDLDHTKPFDEGGLTCECNLAPLCRRHHRAKQAPGWRLIHERPGVLRWQLPSGREYHAKAHSYPV